MGCNLGILKSRDLSCMDNVGGIKAVSFVQYSEANILTVLLGEVATIPAGISQVYRYKLKNSGNTYSEEITVDKDARTVFYNGSLSLVLQKLDLETRNQVKMLGMSELLVFIETNAGAVYVMGNKNGALITGGSLVSGGARGEFNGANLTITSEENEPIVFLSEAAKTAYKLLIAPVV